MKCHVKRTDVQLAKGGHACKYKGGKSSEGNSDINHQPSFLVSLFSFKYLFPEREGTFLH